MAKKKAAAKSKGRTTAKKAAPKKKAAAKKVTKKKAAPKKKTAAKKVTKKKAAPKKKAAAKKVAKKKATPKKKVAAKKKVTTKEKAAPKKKAAVKKPLNKAPEKTVSRRAVVVEQKKKVKKPPTSIRENSKDFKPSAPTNVKTIKNTSGKILGHRATHELNKLTNKKKVAASKATKRKSILGGDKGSGAFKRYSDKELERFKKAIVEKLEKARTELNYLQGLITRKDSSGTEDTESRYASMEDGSLANQREQLNQMAGRQIKFINNLEKAIIRIKNKTYGVCRETGNLISKKRLLAVPHATLSKAAKDSRR